MKTNHFFKDLQVVAISIMGFLLIGEALLRIYLHSHIFYDIEMSRYSMIAKADSVNPKIGHVHKPNVHARLMGVDVRINSDGLRDEEYPVARDGKHRIIILGDSLTLGWGVEKEDMFETLLEKKLSVLRPTEILNFGTGNYNTEQEVNLFLEKGLKYKPDQVVLFYFINDAEVTPKKSKWWFLGYSRIITFYWSRMNEAKKRLVPSKRFKDHYVNLYAANQHGLANAEKAFLQLKDVCKKNAIALQVVLLPEMHNFVDYPFRKEYNLISGFLKENEIDRLDITPYFENVKTATELWVAIDDAHPNAAAHKMIADASSDFIAERMKKVVS